MATISRRSPRQGRSGSTLFRGSGSAIFRGRMHGWRGGAGRGGAGTTDSGGRRRVGGGGGGSGEGEGGGVEGARLLRGFEGCCCGESALLRRALARFAADADAHAGHPRGGAGAAAGAPHRERRRRYRRRREQWRHGQQCRHAGSLPAPPAPPHTAVSYGGGDYLPWPEPAKYGGGPS